MRLRRKRTIQSVHNLPWPENVSPIETRGSACPDHSPENGGANAYDPECCKQCRVSDQHDEQRPEKDGSDRGTAAAEDAFTLMKRAPPVDRELDDGKINRADDCENSSSTRRAVLIFRHVPEGHVAEIKKKKQQERSQSRVPDPVGAP